MCRVPCAAPPAHGRVRARVCAQGTNAAKTYSETASLLFCMQSQRDSAYRTQALAELGRRWGACSGRKSGFRATKIKELFKLSRVCFLPASRCLQVHCTHSEVAWHFSMSTRT